MQKQKILLSLLFTIKKIASEVKENYFGFLPLKLNKYTEYGSKI
jgi:hypothetical protein